MGTCSIKKLFNVRQRHLMVNKNTTIYELLLDESLYICIFFFFYQNETICLMSSGRRHAHLTMRSFSIMQSSILIYFLQYSGVFYNSNIPHMYYLKYFAHNAIINQEVILELLRPQRSPPWSPALPIYTHKKIINPHYSLKCSIEI